jgi:hypothetical protein
MISKLVIFKIGKKARKPKTGEQEELLRKERTPPFPRAGDL